MLKRFKEDVDKGLSAKEKHLSSKYFYDATGDVLFQKIMHLEEYYLTKSEYEIFNSNKSKIVDYLERYNRLSVLELGAGDGTKTKLLLSEMINRKIAFDYVPIDISENAIEKLKNNLSVEFPSLELNPIVDTYDNAISSLGKQPKLILFLGSNIGNFSKLEAKLFLQKLYSAMNKGDMILIGIDLMKNPKVILDAYNDTKGVTKAFNLNLLARINRELGANFDLLKFDHYPMYNPDTGEAKSYIVSLHNQKVHIESLGKTFEFKAGETIFTEISNKYKVDELKELAVFANYNPITEFYDCKQYFINVLWEK